MCFLMLLCFTVGYSLLNVLDPKAAGAMVEAIFPEGKLVWLDQIRDRFLHPTSDNVAAYANAILGEDGGDDLDDTTDPTQGEVIILSSGGSDRSQEGLTSRPTRAGPPQGTAIWPVNVHVADDDVETAVDTAEQLEIQKKKKKEDKSDENKVEGTTVKAPRKHPSTSSFLSYVVVSNTLSGLDAGDKRTEHDPDDDATLTEIMKKKKVLEDKKKELDEKAAAALATKKSKLQRETPPGPSESEIDLGVFSAKHGNLLEKIYASSGSKGKNFCLYVLFFTFHSSF
ncbi:hypothetical protein Hanom_Chr11g00990521 [Helianthus anomalus]